MSIKNKILVPMIILIIITASIILVANIFSFSKNIETTMESRVCTASEVAVNTLEKLKYESSLVSLYIAGDQIIMDSLLNRDYKALMNRAEKLQKQTNVEFCVITDSNGNVLIQTKESYKYGDSIVSQTNIKSAMSGKSLSAIERGSAMRLSVCSGSPVYDSVGNIIGIISVGFYLDTNNFVDSIKDLIGCETTIFYGDERISTTIIKDDGTRAIGTKAMENVSETVLSGKTHTGIAKVLNKDAFTKYVPITGADGKVLGMLFVGLYMDEKAETVQTFIFIGLFIVLIILIISTPCILFIAKHIVKPIEVMVKASNALAVGDVGINVQIETRDEMRNLANAVNDMIESIRKQAQAINLVADGDLTISVKTRSDKDVINNALNSMININNEIFSKIVCAAEKVTLVAQHMAESSQFMAQGSIEQDVAVDELSALSLEISKTINDNAEFAERATELSNLMKNNAEKGNRQMNDLVKSVSEINQASINISKIIKVIDDIAFQTNMLALNAAVEAAKAGQHGKGFAVVAEEVRNLAAMSASAAKDSENIIADSIQKADLGAHIANETAVSLADIVSSINESGQLITEIAKVSEQQLIRMTQMSKSINQVSRVAKQNSIVAEKSAEFSIEMSGQSNMLSKLVSRFKLKDTSNGC